MMYSETNKLTPQAPVDNMFTEETLELLHSFRINYFGATHDEDWHFEDLDQSK